MPRTQLLKGQSQLKALCAELLTKLTRLRNKASLVIGDPIQGRNLTALRNTAAQVEPLLALICEPRCLVCGCTENDCSECIRRTGEPCTWIKPGLCSACAPTKGGS